MKKVRMFLFVLFVSLCVACPALFAATPNQGTMIERMADDVNRPLAETGVLVLATKDQQIDAQDFTAEAEKSLGDTYTGEVLSVCLFAGEIGDGAILETAGYLYIFDADPSISSGDTAITLAERKTLIGMIKVDVTDWDSDATGGSACIIDSPIPFHAVSTLYFSFRPDVGSTAINSAAGDEETLDMNAWLRYDSD